MVKGRDPDGKKRRDPDGRAADEYNVDDDWPLFKHQARDVTDTEIHSDGRHKQRALLRDEASAIPLVSATPTPSPEVTAELVTATDSVGVGYHVGTTEVEEKRTSRSGNDDNSRRCGMCWVPFALGILFTAVVVVGVVCGMGYCKSNDSFSEVTETAAPVPPTPEGTASPPPKGTAPPTPKGTAPPTRESPVPMPDRSLGIALYINNITLAGREIVYKVTTNLPPPEELALQWLIEDDPSQLNADTDANLLRLRQRYALATLYFQSTGESWTTSTGWLGNNFECNWFGITCRNLEEGNSGEQLKVTQIELRNNNLFGGLPSDICLLTALEKFWVLENSISGTLPQSIGQLTNLERFSVEANVFEGTLPSSIQEWTSLTRFAVARNAFAGPLPDSIGAWTDLVEFWIWENEFTGTIPESISNWRILRQAAFYDNFFTGEMPTGICDVSSLTELVVDCAEVECSCCTNC